MTLLKSQPLTWLYSGPNHKHGHLGSAPTCDEGHDGLRVRAIVVLDEVFCSLLLSAAADLTDQDDALGGRVLEQGIALVTRYVLSYSRAIAQRS